MKKKFIITLMLILCSLTFSSCGVKKYDAKIYDNAKEWMIEKYLQDNSTQNAKYYDEYIDNDTRPITNTQVISNKIEFDNAFKEFPDEVDFEQEMLIAYFFTGAIIVNTTTGRKIFTYRIKKINLKNSILNIVFEKKKMVDGPTGSPPTQECLVVKMKKVEFTEINIDLQYA